MLYFSSDITGKLTMLSWGLSNPQMMKIMLEQISFRSEGLQT